MDDQVTQNTDNNQPVPSAEPQPVTPVPEPVVQTPPQAPNDHVVKISTLAEVLVAIVLMSGSFWWWLSNRPLGSGNLVPIENSSEAEEIMIENNEPSESLDSEASFEQEVELLEEEMGPYEESSEEPTARSLRNTRYLGALIRFLEF